MPSSHPSLLLPCQWSPVAPLGCGMMSPQAADYTTWAAGVGLAPLPSTPAGGHWPPLHITPGGAADGSRTAADATAAGDDFFDVGALLVTPGKKAPPAQPVNIPAEDDGVLGMNSPYAAWLGACEIAGGGDGGDVGGVNGGDGGGTAAGHAAHCQTAGGGSLLDALWSSGSAADTRYLSSPGLVLPSAHPHGRPQPSATWLRGSDRSRGGDVCPSVEPTHWGDPPLGHVSYEGAKSREIQAMEEAGSGGCASGGDGAATPAMTRRIVGAVLPGSAAADCTRQEAIENMEGGVCGQMRAPAASVLQQHAEPGAVEPSAVRQAAGTHDRTALADEIRCLRRNLFNP
jgi:hypothetical protein